MMDFWSRREDSNPLREAYKATALPVELHRHWYGQRDSNPRLDLERVASYRWTIAAWQGIEESNLKLRGQDPSSYR